MAFSITSLNRLSAVFALFGSIKLALVSTPIPWISHAALSTALLACMCHLVVSFHGMRAQQDLAMGFQAWWGILAIVMATAPGFSLHSGLFFYAVAAAGLAVLHCYCWINEPNAETSNQPAGIESVVALFLFVLVSLGDWHQSTPFNCLHASCSRVLCRFFLRMAPHLCSISPHMLLGPASTARKRSL
jgi:hypothetical protein